MNAPRTLTPRAVRVSDRYDDGANSRHYTFEPCDGAALAPAAPGQFFMLSVAGAGEAAFTYARLPDRDGRFDALIRRVGTLTRAAFELRPGAVAGYRGPFGAGWPLAEFDTARCLIVAGGCGLAPLAPALEALLARPGGRLCLLYGAKTEEARVLRRERAAWQERLAVIEVLEESAEKARRGRVDAFLDGALAALGGTPTQVLCCGPEIMMAVVARRCAAAGVPRERIWLSLERRMHCGVGTCGHCYVGHSYACQDGPAYRYDRLLALLAPEAGAGAAFP